MVPTDKDKSQDVGQFNAWLSNLAPGKGVTKPLPPKTPTPAPKPAPAGQTAKGGGLLGSVDEELDDIFGRITAADAAAAPAAVSPTQEAAPGKPRTLQDVPRPPMHLQPTPTAAPQPTVTDSPLAKVPPISVPPRVEPKPITQAPAMRPQEAAAFKSAAVSPTPAPAISEKEIQERIDRAVAEARATMQSQIKDLQAKYQEQRQKWERLLSELRTRNEELHRQNQGLEEELASLRERHRQLLQELSFQRSMVSAPEAAEDLSAGFRPPEVPTQAPEAEISIAIPPSTVEPQPAEKPVVALEIEPVVSEQPVGGEADDLLAELEALEKEMKNIGGEG